MKPKNETIIENNKVNFELLFDAECKPPLFSVGEELFWDDPHISKKMLESHLQPTSDGASRNHKTIDQTVEWLVSYINLKEGAKVLDLGCGPGLYCTRLSQRGYKVIGMDYSRNSINYAVNFATENCMDIQYIYQNYLTMDYSCEFDAIFLIYCDFGALSDSNRDILLKRIHKALKPEGVFVFDVFTRFNWGQQSSRNWYVSDAGFWRPCPNLVLDQTLHYEEENVFLKQYIVIENSGNTATYKIWDHYYSKETISKLMKEQGYQVQNIWSDLTGKPYEADTTSLGVAVKKINSNDE